MKLEVGVLDFYYTFNFPGQQEVTTKEVFSKVKSVLEKESRYKKFLGFRMRLVIDNEVHTSQRHVFKAEEEQPSRIYVFLLAKRKSNLTALFQQESKGEEEKQPEPDMMPTH